MFVSFAEFISSGFRYTKIVLGYIFYVTPINLQYGAKGPLNANV